MILLLWKVSSRRKKVVLFPSLSIILTVWCQPLSSKKEVMVSVFFELCRVLTLMCWRWSASRWLLWWCRPVRCLVVCLVLLWIWRGWALPHIYIFWRLDSLSVWLQRLCALHSRSAFGMFCSIERLAEHPVAVHRQKSLVSDLRWMRWMYPLNPRFWLPVDEELYVFLCICHGGCGIMIWNSWFHPLYIKYCSLGCYFNSQLRI